MKYYFVIDKRGSVFPRIPNHILHLTLVNCFFDNWDNLEYSHVVKVTIEESVDVRLRVPRKCHVYMGDAKGETFPKLTDVLDKLVLDSCQFDNRTNLTQMRVFSYHIMDRKLPSDADIMPKYVGFLHMWDCVSSYKGDSFKNVLGSISIFNSILLSDSVRAALSKPHYRKSIKTCGIEDFRLVTNLLKQNKVVDIYDARIEYTDKHNYDELMFIFD